MPFLWRHIHWINIHWIIKRPYLQIYQPEPTETLQAKSEWNYVNNCFKIFIVLETLSVPVSFWMIFTKESGTTMILQWQKIFGD